MAKPAHLSEVHAAQWEDACMAQDYPHRPPYPDEVFALLTDLMEEEGAVLDLGCGTGDLARRLAPRVARVDAVDRSAAMLARGRALPDGDHPNLRWIHATAERAELLPPYALVTVGESIQWMEADRLLPRLAGLRLALLERETQPLPWAEEIERLFPRYSTNQDFRPYDPFAEATASPLFRLEGERRTHPVPFLQPLSGYLASFHSRNGFSRGRMGEERAKAFDREVERLVAPHCPGGIVHLQITALVCWGRVET
ncbi:MAG: class I SAM-dependent methyltransferase [Planctomycetota bacterium]